MSYLTRFFADQIPSSCDEKGRSSSTSARLSYSRLDPWNCMLSDTEEK